MGFAFSMTGTQFITSIRDTIGDPSGSAAPRFKDGALMNYANRALAKIAVELEHYLETSWATTLVDGTGEIDTPAAFYMDKMAQVEQTSPQNNRILTYLNFDQMKDLIARDPSREGMPEFYWLWRRLGTDSTAKQSTVLRLYPVPGSAQDGLTLRLFGYKFPDQVTEDNQANVVEIETVYAEAAVLYAAALAKQDDRELSAANVLFGRFEREIMQAKGWASRKSRSGRPRIRPRRTSYNSGAIPPWKPYGSNFIMGW